MRYTAEDSERFVHESMQAVQLLRKLIHRCSVEANKQRPLVTEHLLHGAGRRIKIMARATENIFRLFPPNTLHPIPDDDMGDVQINLHAFFINLFGVFENFAWAFAYRHGLNEVLDRNDIGLFRDKTRRFLPKEISDYLISAEMTQWTTEYLKTYRDALAHQVPLYVPPCTFTPEEGEKYLLLFDEEIRLLRGHDFEGAEALRAERENLGSPNFLFVPAFSKLDKQRPVYLHPQIISDSMTVLECGRIFFDYWHLCPDAPVNTP